MRALIGSKLASSVTAIVFLVCAFAVSAYYSQQYAAELQEMVLSLGFLGQLLYFVISLLSVVLAPCNTLFLLPVAAAAWGPFTAATLSIAGWTAGSIIAYLIARRYGRPLVSKIVDLDHFDRALRQIPENQIFWWVVAMRMVVSVDVLSYALGVLLSMSYTTYAIATLIGVTPFAFIFAYTAMMPMPYMVTVLSCAAIATALGTLAIWRVWQKDKPPAVEADS